MSEDTQKPKRKRKSVSQTRPKSKRKAATIRLPFDQPYEQLVSNPVAYRLYLQAYSKQHPEVFPDGFQEGFDWHDQRQSKKQKHLIIRRIKLKNDLVYQLVPASIMPYLTGETSLLSQGLWLRHWAVPYEVIAHLLGKNALYWERAEQALGRLSIVGSLVKKGGVPLNLAADEKVTRWNGQEAYIGLTSSQDCLLGSELSLNEDGVHLQQVYGVFKAEALDVSPTYQPQSVNLDGWKATNQAWRTLFEGITIVLCFLHAYLKIRDVGKSLKEHFPEVGNKIWQAYHQPTKSEFRQEIAALLVWIQSNTLVNERVREKVEDLCAKVSLFEVAYDHPQCYRTSNQIDRPMDALDRYLYQIRYFRGHRHSANLKVRSWAMIYNFMPLCQRVQKRKERPKKSSRFEELNGFVYHSNWLENLLIAGSMNGFRTSHKIR